MGRMRGRLRERIQGECGGISWVDFGRPFRRRTRLQKVIVEGHLKRTCRKDISKVPMLVLNFPKKRTCGAPRIVQQSVSFGRSAQAPSLRCPNPNIRTPKKTSGRFVR